MEGYRGGGGAIGMGNLLERQKRGREMGYTMGWEPGEIGKLISQHCAILRNRKRQRPLIMPPISYNI